MSLCRYWSPAHAGPRIGLVLGDRVHDLTATGEPAFASFTGMLARPDLADVVAAAADAVTDEDSLDYASLDISPDPERAYLLPLIAEQEVWGTGETYTRKASPTSDASPFDRAYFADRPELFFKATPHRVAGPNAPIRARPDAELVFPEPELALVYNRERRLVGYTIANDVTAYSLCDENILYMPQVKTFMGCCALGPALVLVEDVPDFRKFTIDMHVERDGAEAFRGTAELATMRREFDQIADYLFREQDFVDGVVLMTGLGFDLPHGFTIRPGDVVHIEIAGIGRLRNPVT